MKIRTPYLTKWLVFLSISLGFLACEKNADKDREQPWYSSEEVKEPLTSKEIAEALPHFPRQSDLFFQSEVIGFYKARNNVPAWNDKKIRDQFYNELLNAGEEGLSFKDYHGRELDQLMGKIDGLQEEELLKLEIFLTDAYFKYAGHLLNGKLNPQTLFPNWGVNQDNAPLPDILQQAIETGDVVQSLSDLKPSHQVYHGLKNSLKDYRALKEKEEENFRKIQEGEPVKPGEKDSRVAEISSRLKHLGHLDDSHPSEENRYDREIEAAVKEFQKEKGLIIDGVIGNSTIQELNMDAQSRYHQILANLERWRWYPRDLGEHYILVNIPDFKLVVVKDSDTVKTHNVVAGSKARQTPVFTDTLEYIVINPLWNIPPTIKNEDIIPKAAQDPAYLRKNNIIVSSAGGERLDAERIDWTAPEVSTYNYTQRPGASNPLGRVKIIYPNRYLVYLHDTPAQSLFGNNDRAASSGCVRVEDAIELSAYLVNSGEEWNLDKINEVISSGKTTHVKINRPILVHHFYWTSWRDGDKTIFRDDVYDLDKKVYEALLEN